MFSSTGVVFTLYLLMMFGMGVYFYFRTKTLDDFVLGGRTLGSFPSAVSSVASDFSGWLLLGLPGFALSGGTGAFWISLGLLVGTYFNWTLVAPKLRSDSAALGNAVTIPIFLERKIKDQSGIIRITLSLAILFFFTLYTSSGLISGGKLFSSTFDVDYKVAVFLGFIIIVSYTFLGGYLAVCWTDVIQGILMIGALIIVPVMAINSLGGVDTTIESIKATSPNHFSLFKNPDGSTQSIITILSLAAWGLGYFGQPHILTRFMGISPNSDVKTAKKIAVSWSFVSMTMSLVVGYVGVAYFLDTPLDDPEKVFITLIDSLTHPIVAGLLISAIMAAVMSTADSQLLIASSAFTNDLFNKRLSKYTENSTVWIGRVSVIIVSVIALFLSLNENTSILGVVGYAWAGLGATVGPLLLLTLLWGRVTPIGGVFGIITGALVTIAWNILRKSYPDSDIFSLYELLPAFISALIVIFIVSKITYKPMQQDS